MKTKKNLLENTDKLITITGISFLAYFSIKYFNVTDKLDDLNVQYDSVFSAIEKIENNTSKAIEYINQDRINTTLRVNSGNSGQGNSGNSGR